MVAVADRSGEIRVPDEAKPMPLPPRDAATIRAEAKEIDEALHRDIERLHALGPPDTGKLEAELLAA